MKRVLILAVSCLTAALLFATFASGQNGPPVVPSNVTAKATPKTDLKRPHVFRISGTALPTRRPVKCAAGVTNPAYCSPAKPADICKGTVRITIKRGVKAIARTNVTLSGTCTYSAKITIRKKMKHGTLFVVSRFLGNGLVGPRNSSKLRIKV